LIDNVRVICRVAGDARNGTQSRCLTCSGSSDCQYVDASFSHTGQYYILACLGPGVPSYRLHHADGRTSQLHGLLCYDTMWCDVFNL